MAIYLGGDCIWDYAASASYGAVANLLNQYRNNAIKVVLTDDISDS
jgi:hypothetical protein